MATINFQLFNLIRNPRLELDYYDSGGGANWTAIPPQYVAGTVTGTCSADVPNDGFVTCDYYLGARRDMFLQFSVKVFNDEPKIHTFASVIDYKVEHNYRSEGNHVYVVNIDYRRVDD